jgi:tripartite-type tricarboxylate transporter receptor subunit TctC
MNTSIRIPLSPALLRWAAAAATAALALGLQPAWSQPYPARPVKIVVGYSAGGAVDIVARTMAQSLAAGLGQPFVVDNKPGAGTNIAVKYVIDAAPDGYTC